ncbi:hypothetical protein LTR36_000926 [Oleoguttula mirabilis]|uniref:Uncharacterized protein n=1 Tax=Oleoguttula mirabilis TaxID=1507867 RepID=A0AAV9JPB4_9PEZI|nr:hypothetical protein LTR36_000926 [Oleoguttula mirabilis]
MPNSAMNNTFTSAITDSTTTVTGWQSSPNGRGTLDIIQSCVTTIFLCTYTALYLNVRPRFGAWSTFLYKLKWVLFTLFCPEVVAGLAIEQWRSARQSAQEFAKLREQRERSRDQARADHSDSLEALERLVCELQESPWTSKHAFLADMGGVQIDFPDFVPFPVNSHQLHWLVEGGHIDYPTIEEKTIRDKDKADIFARAITALQVVWFTIQCIARGIQHLGLTTHCILFWRDKPLNIGEPIVLVCPKPLAQILAETGHDLHREPWYGRTPLDFVESEPKFSYMEPFFIGLQLPLNMGCKKAPLRARFFSNTGVHPPHGLPLRDIALITIDLPVYCAIHLAARSFQFPTRIESLCWPGCYLGRLLLGADKPYIIQQAVAIPRWMPMSGTVPVLVIYYISRVYIIVEGFVNLRSQPATVFQDVDWWRFVPHP